MDDKVKIERRAFEYGLVIPDRRKKKSVIVDKMVLLKSAYGVWKEIRIRRTG